MKIVIVGAGRVGYAIAEQLLTEGMTSPSSRVTRSALPISLPRWM